MGAVDRYAANRRARTLGAALDSAAESAAATGYAWEVYAVPNSGVPYLAVPLGYRLQYVTGELVALVMPEDAVPDRATLAQRLRRFEK